MKSITVAVHKIVFGQPCRYFALALREFLSTLAIIEHYHRHQRRRRWKAGMIGYSQCADRARDHRTGIV